MNSKVGKIYFGYSKPDHAWYVRYGDQEDLFATWKMARSWLSELKEEYPDANTCLKGKWL